VNEQFINMEGQVRMKTEILAGVLEETSAHGQQAEILSSEYPEAFGLQAPCTAKQLWQHILTSLLERAGHPGLDQWQQEISVILNEGTLSDRILRSMNKDYSLASMKNVYRHLADCLAQNKMYLG
jgi:carboxylate-amine ligase